MKLYGFIVVLSTAASASLTCAQAIAQAPGTTANEQTIVRAGSLPSSPGPDQNFTGKAVWTRCSRPRPKCPMAPRS